MIGDDWYDDGEVIPNGMASFDGYLLIFGLDVFDDAVTFGFECYSGMIYG